MSRTAAPARIVLAMSLLPPLAGMQQPAFRSGTLGVRVDVLATDGRTPVSGLTLSDFELRDDGVRQTIEVVETGDVPINVVLALDVSASTEGKRRADLIDASHALLAGLKARDRVALTTFSHAVVPRIPLTTDVAAVAAALDRMEPAGRTAVLDAAYVALTATLAQPGRSLVVVCTDGADVSSWLQTDDVLDAARRANAVVYAVTASDARRTTSLEKLTDATGGDVLRVSSSGGLRSAFEQLLKEFRSRYVLTYTPTGVPAGGFHALDVRVRRRGVTVRARPGYIGVEAVR